MDLHGFDLPIFFTVFFSSYMSTFEVLPQPPGMMISKVAAPPSSPRKLGEARHPAFQASCETSTTWVETVCKQNPMGSHGPAPKLPGKYGRNLNRMVLCKTVFFKSSIARQFLGFMIHLKFSGVAMPPHSSQEQAWIIIPGSAGKASTFLAPQ